MVLSVSHTGDTRKVALTEPALRYFRDEREDEKKKLRQQFALTPKLNAALWSNWHNSPPADTVARSHLKAERGLNEQGARSLLAIYKDNLAFADLKGDVTIPDENQEGSEMDMQQDTGQQGARAPKPGVQRSDFPLAEGVARIEFPEKMSAESYEDLDAWLKLLLRRAKRSVKENDA